MSKLLIALATVIHLIPHPFGVSPVGATAMYAGTYGKRRTSWMVPMLPLLVGHLYTGFYDLTVMGFVYAGFALSTVSGRLLIREKSLGNFSAAVIASATIFFLVSNFSIWLVGMYPPTPAGLLQCYINGLPYLGAGIAANAVYGTLLYGLHTRLQTETMKPLPA